MIRGGKTLTISPHNISIYSPRVVAAANWWLSGGISSSNARSAYAAKGAASLAASYINLVNPGTNNAAPGVAPTWDVTNGWKMDSTQYLYIGGVFPAGGSVIIRFSDYNNASGKYLYGYGDGPPNRHNISLQESAGGVHGYLSGSGGNQAVAGVNLSGTYALTNTGYYNGLAETVVLDSAANANSRTPIVGGALSIGTPSFLAVVYIQAVATYSTIITAAQVLAVHTAMMAL